MRAVSVILGVVVLILLMAAVMVGIRDFRSAEKVELYNVTTAAGVTTGNITLTQALFDDATANADLISSLTTDAPVASTYTKATKVMLVSGLTAGTSRQLTVTYRYGQLDDYWAADIGSRAIPTMLIIGILGIIGGAVYVSYLRRD